MTTFKELGLNPEIMESLNDLGFTEPSPIQEKAIPFILESKNDLIALAQTGTGKTAAFGLPILNQIKTNERDLQTIILCPTRELCLQIAQDIEKFAKHSKGVSVTAVYGGERIDVQIRSLKNGTNIVVGTPGRVHDLIRRRILKLQNIKWLVLDEADEMLDMGFKDDLDAILGETSKERQTLLFSATMSSSVRSIAKKYMNDTKEISVGESNIGADKVVHEYYIVQLRDRFEALKRVLDYLPGVYGIIFCRTKRETQDISDKLKQANYDTESLHGDVSQDMRTKIMDRFKKKKVRLLVATDVAARGIDVEDLTHIINYNIPDQTKIYTHRSGRTGRAQKSGVSISIVNPKDLRKIKELERVIGKSFELKKVPNGEDVCRKQIDNFVNEIESTDIKEIGNEVYFKEIVDKLKEISKEDLIKYFINHKFKDLITSNKNAYNLNADAKPVRERMASGDEVSLEINIGKRNGFDVKGLFSLINSNRSLQGVEIGRISLMPEFSIVSVEKNRADDVIKYLQGTSFRGKKIDIKKSDKKPSFQGSGRSGPRRGGFNKKRGGFRRDR